MPYKSCASSTAGMSYSRKMTRWRRQSSATNHTDTPTAIQERIFSPGQDICSSSLLTNGPSGRNCVLKFFLNNIRTSKRHTDCATHCAWSSPWTPSRMQPGSPWHSGTIKLKRQTSIHSMSLLPHSTSIMMRFWISITTGRRMPWQNPSMPK